MSTRKDLPNPNAPNFLQRVREEIHALLGKTGSARDRALTLADAIASGVITTGAGGSLVPGPGVTDVYELDRTPPPQPDLFTATPAISHILIEQPAPTYTQGHGHLRTRVYGATHVDGEPLPVFADAVEVGQFEGAIWALASNPSTTWHLWIKWESRDGELSATPAGGTNGVVATTGQDVSSLLNALAGKLTEEQLLSSLKNRIDLIDGPSTLNGSVAARLASEAAARANAIAAEASTRAQAILDEAAARASGDSALQTQINMLSAAGSGDFAELLAAVQEEQEARVAGDAAEATARQTLAAQMRGDYDGTDPSALTTGLLYNERQARVDADGALSSSISSLSATVTQNFNTLSASISAEQTARVNSDGALSTSISSVSAVANSKNKTFYQASAPTTGITAGDLWFDSDDSNRAYRYSGTSWVLTADTRIAANTAAITAEQTARANADTSLAQQITTVAAQAASADATLNAAIQSEATARANAVAAEASARETLAATVQSNNAALTTAIQTEATTRATQTGDLYAKREVKIDLAGHLSGYGLMSQASVNESPSSAFGIRADQFFVAPPATSSAAAPTTNLYKGMVWVDTSVTPNVTRYYTGSAWSTTPQALPFVVQATPTTINGVAVPPGAYFNDAFIQNGTITNAKIANLAVDDAKIANLSVSKLTAGSIEAGEYAQSTGYVAGSSGWRINGDGTAEFSGVVVRGTIFASQGEIGGITIASNAVRAGQSGLNAGQGFYLGSDGTLSIGDSAGERIVWDGSSLEIETADFGLSDGNARFSGDISGATGSFAGTLLAGTIDVTQLVGQTFTYSTPGTSYVTVPASFTRMRITAVGGGGGGGAGGGGNIGGGGGGGGSGGLSIATFTVTPGSLITVYVGSGGGPGIAGQESSVYQYISAGYGLPGGNGSSNMTAGAGGSGGSGTTAAGNAGSSGTPGYQNYSCSYDSKTGIIDTCVLVNQGPGVGGAGGASRFAGYGAGGRGGNGQTGAGRTGGSNGFVQIEFFNPNGVIIRSDWDTLQSALLRQGIQVV